MLVEPPQGELFVVYNFVIRVFGAFSVFAAGACPRSRLAPGVLLRPLGLLGGLLLVDLLGDLVRGLL